MDIKMKLNRNFMACLNKLRKKYGEDFERINGFHQMNLNFTDFIDNFIDSKNVADVSIDANANSSTKDINTLKSDMMKPHLKLLAFNKIFYEITKKYGLATAEEWLEHEWNGAFYLHNASTSTYLPYCYKGEENIIIKYKNNIHSISFKELYNLIEEDEQYDATILEYAKFPENLYVLDLDSNNNKQWTLVTRIVKHYNDKNMRFIKYANGISQIVTDDHPIITTVGDVSANQITKNHFVTTYKSNEFTNTIEKIDNIELTKELGWLFGIILSEKISQDYTLTITQDLKSNQSKKILEILEKHNVPFRVSLQDNRIRLLSCPIQKMFLDQVENLTSQDIKMKSDYIHYNYSFLDGVVAGMIDGDGTIDGYKNRHCQIRIASRELLNQISLYLQSKNIFVTDRIPFLYQRENSFNSKLTMYGIGFTLTDEKYFMNIGSIKINSKYEKLTRNGDFKNKRYSYNYGQTQVIENIILDEKCDEVYDITTTTGHFICNNVLSHNCYAYDLDLVVEKGLFFIDKFKSTPAQHLTTFNDHVLEFISWTSNRSSGAVGLPSYLVYSYYYWYKDVKNNFYLKNPEYYRKQCFQKFIYDLNQPYLRITECAFTNISIMDRNYLVELFGARQFPNGEYVIDHIEEIIQHQKVFMETIAEIREKLFMTFPVLTFSLLFQDGKFVDEEFARWCNKHNLLWYDSNNYVGNDVTTLSNCCRLLSDTSKLNGFINSIGGTSLSIGSVQVNTTNLRKIALECNRDKDEYIRILSQRTHLSIKVLDVIRGIIKRNIEKGLLPNYTYGLIKMENQYNTLGTTATYEAVRDMGFIGQDEFGNKFYTDEGLDFGCRIYDTINEIKESYNFDYSINVECVPAERANSVLCAKDNLLYPDQNKDFLYSNQWIPLMESCTLQEKIKLGSILDIKCGGGQISHINLQGKFNNEEQAWDMLNYIAKSGVIYSAYNIQISVCKNGHGFYGNLCPTCGEPKIDVFSRIVGYLVPTQSYSKDRKREFDKRKWFILD